MRKIFLLFGILLVLVGHEARAEEIQVAGSVDKTQVQIDEEVSFTIRVLGARGNLQAPRLPAFAGFDSFYTGRTSHYTFINGRSSASVEFSYILVPKVAGRFTLEPVQIWVDGKSYSTQPMEVEVIGNAAQVSQTGASSGPPSLPSRLQTGPAPAPATTSALPTAVPVQVVDDDNLFVKVTLDKPIAFPNEQVLLSYTLYTRYDTRYEGFEEEPEVSGFWIEDFPLDQDLGRETVSMNGRRYVKADVRKIALFPTDPADYTVRPGVLKVSIREEPKTSGLFDEFFGDSFFSGSSFFARRVDRLLKPDPIKLTVRPFPDAGKPASFNGAVGRFQMSASVDKSDVNQNEPVTLRIILEGEGNIETLPKPPVPELTGFKVYDGDTSTQRTRAGQTLGGKKTFEIIFIPTEAGEMSIPPLEFSFFEPWTQKYQVLRTPSFPLKVSPSDEPLKLPAELLEKDAYKKEVTRESKDIRFIHEELPSRGAEAIGRLLYAGLGLANVLGLLFVGTGLVARRRAAIFARDLGLKRRKLAKGMAAKRLKKLKQMIRGSGETSGEQFLEEAEKVLDEYFSDKFNVSAYSFTREWLDEKLSEVWGPEEPLLKRVRDFYDLTRGARFGRGTFPPEERQALVELLETVIERFERMK